MDPKTLRYATTHEWASLEGDLCTLGITKFEMMQRERFSGFPLVDIRARFLIPSRFGDDVVVESGVSEFRRSSFDVQHRLLKAGELAVECLETNASAGSIRHWTNVYKNLGAGTQTLSFHFKAGSCTWAHCSLSGSTRLTPSLSATT